MLMENPTLLGKLSRLRRLDLRGRHQVLRGGEGRLEALRRVQDLQVQEAPAEPELGVEHLRQDARGRRAHRRGRGGSQFGPTEFRTEGIRWGMEQGHGESREEIKGGDLRAETLDLVSHLSFALKILHVGL